MIILVDSREQRNQHILQKFSELDIKFKCKKLEFGDYSFEIDGISFENICAIERKANLTELSGNLCQGRTRFETEFCKGLLNNCKMVLLIEDESVREKCKLRVAMDKTTIDADTKFRKTWRSRMTGNSMVASIKAFKERYNLELVFCKKNQTANKMLEIFEREVKNYAQSEK